MAASSGNGTDMGSVVAMLGDLIAGQHDVSVTLVEHGRRFDAMDRRFDAMDRKFDAMDRKFDDLTSHVESLREAVTMYHSSVLGHGILISELDARVRRIEHHLDLPPAA